MKSDGNYCGRLQPIALSRWFPGRLCAWLAVVMAFLASDRIESAAIPVQPASAAANPGNYADRIRVKFRDDLPIRLRDGQLTDAGSGALDALAPFLERWTTAGATWRRQHSLPESTLAQLRQTAQTNLNRAVADLNTGFILRLPPGLDAGAVIDQFNTWPQVEIARPMRRPVPLPTPPDLEPEQGYLGAAPAGVEAQYLWTVPGGTGAGVRIADLEYDWNFNHADLAFSLIGPDPVPPFANSANHGTAVLGILAARRNAWGVTGIAHGSTLHVIAAHTEDGLNIPDAKFNDDHAPFLPRNDSGAILVGAGGPPGHPEGDRARLGSSSYGSTVDLQGWGAGVVTTGGGDRYSAEGTNHFYTATFNGTSSATAMAGGVCAALQGAYKAAYGGRVLSPASLRNVLRAAGSPQLDGTRPATENIGPRPNLAEALPLALATWVNFSYAGLEEGTLLHPFDTLGEGLAFVPSGHTLQLRAGRTNWTGTISQRVTLRAWGGRVTIGQ